MQDDDTANPGMLWVLRRREPLEPERPARREVLRRLPWRCRGQHEGRRRPLSGLRRRPRPSGRSRAAHQPLPHRTSEAEPLAWESNDLLALTAFVAHQSRGLPIAGRRRAPVARVRRSRTTSSSSSAQGQFNLSCSQCHDDNWGKRLGGSVIPQGHPTGYPIYRLEWQSLGSLQRRLRNCMAGRARRALRLRRSGGRRPRALPDGEGPRHADGRPGGAPVKCMGRLSLRPGPSPEGFRRESWRSGNACLECPR